MIEAMAQAVSAEYADNIAAAMALFAAWLAARVVMWAAYAVIGLFGRR